MASLINIGLTGVVAHQTALATTGNNVVNTNTDGYSRQEVQFGTNPSQRFGAGYIGAGVSIDNIRRLNDEFLTNQLRSDTTVFHGEDTFLSHIEQLDSLLADLTTGLSPAMSNFFKALQGGADDPTSIPERQLILSQSDGLVTRFNALYSRLLDKENVINQELSAQVSEINSLSSGIAQLNEAITIASGSAQNSFPNELLDQREESIRKLAELVQVNVIKRGDNQMDILIGNGQALVVGDRAKLLSVMQSPEDSTQQDIAIVENGVSQIISQSITGGKVGGILEFRDTILSDSFNSLGRVAIVLADTINDQHRLGMDLENNLGGYFFEDVNFRQTSLQRASSDAGNALPSDRVVLVDILDAKSLTTDDYVLEFNGPSNLDYVFSRKSDDAVIRKGLLPGTFPASIDVEGFRITLESGAFQSGDRFLIQPTRYGARDIDLQIDRVEEIALASPVRNEADIGNVGNAIISQGELLNVTNPVSNQPLATFSVPGKLTPPMVVKFITDTVYDVLDASDPSNLVSLSPPLNNQHYIAGLKNQLFTADYGQTTTQATGANVAQIPAPIASPGPFTNGYGAQTLTVSNRDPLTGLVTTSTLNLAANASAKTTANALNQINGLDANAYTLAKVGNFTGTTLGLTVNGEAITLDPALSYTPNNVADAINANPNLQDLKIVAVSDGNTITIRSTIGDDITIEATGGVGDSVDVTTANAGPVTVSAGTGTSVGGFIDLAFDNGVSMVANNSNVFVSFPVVQSSYRGFLVDISGKPAEGDIFTIDYNTDGISDNRNAIGLVGLESKGTIAGGVSTYNEGYSQLVEKIGTITNQRKIDTESSKALLQQSENNWMEISGVNLDEEAGRLIQFQSAYNASARVLTVAQEIFDTLLSSF